MRRIRPEILVAITAIGWFGACAERQEPQLVPAIMKVDFADTDTLFPRLRFGDGQISLNDRCIVTQKKLNRRLPPIYVNGRPIGFC